MPRTRRKLLQQRKELVERYVRMAVRRKTAPIAHALARRLIRQRLRWSERKRKMALVSALRTTAEEAARLRGNKHRFEPWPVFSHCRARYSIRENRCSDAS